MNLKEESGAISFVEDQADAQQGSLVKRSPARSPRLGALNPTDPQRDLEVSWLQTLSDAVYRFFNVMCVGLGFKVCQSLFSCFLCFQVLCY